MACEDLQTAERIRQRFIVLADRVGGREEDWREAAGPAVEDVQRLDELNASLQGADDYTLMLDVARTAASQGRVALNEWTRAVTDHDPVARKRGDQAMGKALEAVALMHEAAHWGGDCPDPE